MVVTFYKSTDGDWIELWIDGRKYFGGHSLPADWAVKYIARHARNLPTGINNIRVLSKEFDPREENKIVAYWPGKGAYTEYLGTSEQLEME